MYQQLIVVGRVGQAPELRYSQGGVAVCNLSVAVNEKWTDKATDEKREKTTWFRVTCWRGLAETVNQYVTKGMLVMVIGTITASAWMKDDTPQATLELTAQTVKFLSRVEDQDAPAKEDEYAF